MNLRRTTAGALAALCATVLPCRVSTALAAEAAPVLDTIRYAFVLSDGHTAGGQVVERHADGEVVVKFSYKDNGRGPTFEERFHLAPNGTLADLEVRGDSTMGTPIDEHFSRTGGAAQWRTTTDTGSAGHADDAFYVPIYNSFEINAASVAAVASRPDGVLPLLPSGSLRQRVVDELDVVSGGRHRHVQLLAQTGLGFSPTFLWMTTDARPRLFAVINVGYFTAVEEGWESTGELLTAHQKAAEERLLRDLSDTHRQHLPAVTVVRNARIFDSDSATLMPPSDIYITRGRITAIRPAAGVVGDVDAQIDAGGRIALPGLFDMHAHFSPWDGGLHLAAGITTIRDMGNDNHALQHWIDQVGDAGLLAPRIVPCGFLEGDSPFAAHLGFVIKTLQQAKDAVDWYAVRGYPQLKIYNSFPHDMVREIVAYAHARGMRVSGHVPAFMRAQDVVEQGFDEIQHMNQVLLNFLVTPTTDTRTLERFYLPAEKLAALDFDSKPVQDFVALLASHQTVIDSTLATEDFIKQRDGEMAAPYAAVASHVPPDVKRGFMAGGMKIPDDTTYARYLASYRKMVDFAGRLYRAGVPLIAGTDATPGFTLQAELALYVEAGIPPAKVLQIATRNAALYSRTSTERGSLAVGKLADIVLVDGDPTADIEDIRKVALVITQGAVISPSTLYTALGITPFVPSEPKLVASTAKP